MLIFKHKITHERWILAHYSNSQDIVTLEKGDKLGSYLNLSVNEFLKIFEYCCMYHNTIKKEE